MRDYTVVNLECSIVASWTVKRIPNRTKGSVTL